MNGSFFDPFPVDKTVVDHHIIKTNIPWAPSIVIGRMPETIPTRNEKTMTIESDTLKLAHLFLATPQDATHALARKAIELVDRNQRQSKTIGLKFEKIEIQNNQIKRQAKLIREAGTKIKERDDVIADMRKEIKQLTATNSELTAQINAQQKTMQRKVNDLTARNSELTGQVRAQQILINDPRKNLRIDLVKAQLADLEKAHRKLKKDWRALAKTDGEARSIIASSTALHQTNEGHLKTIAELTANNKELTASNTKLGSLCHSFREITNNLQSPNSKIVDQLSASQKCWDMNQELAKNIQAARPAVRRDVTPTEVIISYLNRDGKTYGNAMSIGRTNYEEFLTQAEIDELEAICPKQKPAVRSEPFTPGFAGRYANICGEVCR